MGPAQNRREGEQEHGDGDKCAAACAEDACEGFCHQRGVVRTRSDDAGLQVDGAGGQDDQSGHGADDHRVRKDFEDTPDALFDRFLGVGVGMDHDGGAEARFVGEYAAFAALRDDGGDGGARGAARDGLDAEGELEYGKDGGGQQ